MLFLTVEQHQEVLRRLLELGKRRVVSIPSHQAGVEYTSLMVCFLLHNLSAADTLLRMKSTFSNEWFPVTVGYTIARTMFETDVNAHYITRDPVKLARQYIDFGTVLNKRNMDACQQHRNSKNPQWRAAMNIVWQDQWASRECDILKEFDAVVSHLRTSIKMERK